MRDIGLFSWSYKMKSPLPPGQAAHLVFGLRELDGLEEVDGEQSVIKIII